MFSVVVEVMEEIADFLDKRHKDKVKVAFQ